MSDDYKYLSRRVSELEVAMTNRVDQLEQQVQQFSQLFNNPEVMQQLARDVAGILQNGGPQTPPTPEQLKELIKMPEGLEIKVSRAPLEGAQDAITAKIVLASDLPAMHAINYTGEIDGVVQAMQVQLNFHLEIARQVIALGAKDDDEFFVYLFQVTLNPPADTQANEPPAPAAPAKKPRAPKKPAAPKAAPAKSNTRSGTGRQTGNKDASVAPKTRARKSTTTRG